MDSSEEICVSFVLILTMCECAPLLGWIDDGVFMQKDGSGGSRGRNMVWNNFGGNTPHHAFTTGRPHPQRSLDGGSATGGSGSGMSGGFAPNKVRPKGPSQTLKMINVSGVGVLIEAHVFSHLCI